MKSLNKDKYFEFAAREPIPIFSQPWWLDAVCIDGQWDVAIFEKNNTVIASLPYYMKNKGPFKLITMPPLTQTMGPFITYPEGQKYAKKLAYEKEVMNVLIDQLPKVDYFCQNFHPSITNWLPFYWRGFSQTTRYTYIIDNINDHEQVYQNFTYAKKKNIKKSENMIHLRFDLDVNSFYENHKLTLGKQGQKIEYQFNLLNRIYENGQQNNGVKIISAHDNDNNIHAALLLVGNNTSAYDLISTIDPTFRNSGAASKLVLEGIKLFSKDTQKFDFEGSMIENVENSFRQFGAIQTPYFQIKKVNSKLLQLRECFNALKK
ncbi:MAG: methicillin resistance protein [Candidatus Margulisiibacteriota bacterium]